ncbi:MULTISPECIES: 8-oxo-dGTP diphosphatase [unclassified Paenibacillus]|uniref:NUDIX hydrolase n=1 Tax=unclassified Paenibacillus TaxID=185978 RepID=UPI001AEAE2D4|nr:MULTISPECIES: 8-oxo-dGTP diphosphatase [unclassified Paenibacillus]MBP1157564.1 8-oxo-dGTP diphosphatase [Paenibacillus sp. PvP091]MBP1171699.1 8-oxo-dGTP diphosphatase [Paenibacillus sp. PvR098]MBP2438080.1 8-oxo-dGTP diphosphatase [Paenibacillus sp. PvP052]
MLKYNIAFIRKGDRILMLNRGKAPLLGLWNGVGGKLEPGETPYDSVVREIEEETGLRFVENTLRFSGIVTWEVDGREAGGMYVFIGEAPSEALVEAPVETEDGILAWKPVEWVVRQDNFGVAGHVKHFLPPMLESRDIAEYRCIFREGKLLSCEVRPLGEALL